LRAYSLINLALVATHQGDPASARALYEESLAIAREIGDKHGIAASLGGLGIAADSQGDTASARPLHEESLALQRELGNQQGMAVSLFNLGSLACKEGDYTASQSCLTECLRLCLALGEKRFTFFALGGFGALATAQGQPERATRLYGASAALSAAIGVPLTAHRRKEADRDLATLRATLGEAVFDSAWSAGRALSWEQAIEYALEDGQFNPGA
jgi:tetratricopeptide (TPR) repeat protein